MTIDANISRNPQLLLYKVELPDGRVMSPDDAAKALGYENWDVWAGAYRASMRDDYEGPGVPQLKVLSGPGITEHPVNQNLTVQANAVDTLKNEGSPYSNDSPPPWYVKNGLDYASEEVLARQCETQPVDSGHYQWNWQAHNCFYDPTGKPDAPQPPKVAGVPTGAAVQPPHFGSRDELNAWAKKLLSDIFNQQDLLKADLLEGSINATKDVLGVRDALRQAVNDAATLAANPVGKVVDTLHDQLKKGADGLSLNPFAILEEALGAIKSIMGAWVQSAADLSDVGGLVEALFTGNLESIDKWVTAWVQKGVGGGLSDIIGGYIQDALNIESQAQTAEQIINDYINNRINRPR